MDQLQNQILTKQNNDLIKELTAVKNQLKAQETATLSLVQEKLDLKTRVKWLEIQWGLAADSRYNTLMDYLKLNEKVEQLEEDNKNLKQELASETNNMIRNKLKTMLTLQQDIVNLLGRV